MSHFKVFLLCSGVLCLITKTEATLAQSSNKFQNDEVINTFSKDVYKKENGVTTTSEAPSSSTLSHHKSNPLISLVSVVRPEKDSKQSVSIHHVSVGGSGKDSDNETSVSINGGGNHQKAVWITLLICLNVLLMFVIALGLRTGYACYKKFYDSQENSTPTSTGAVHFSSGGMEPRIFTVMPGHLVLQIPSGGMQSSSVAVADESNVGTPDTILTPCSSSSMRSESPPPPYVTLYPQLKDD